MTNKVLSVIALLALTTGPIAAAEEKPALGYSYIEGAFAHDNFNANGVIINDRDGIGNTSDDNFGSLRDATGSGGGVRLSFTLPVGSEKLGFHAVADFLQTSHDAGIVVAEQNGFLFASGAVALKQKEIRAALGMHSKGNDRFSLFAELGITNNQVDFGEAVLGVSTGSVTADLAAASGTRTALDARVGARGIIFSRTEILGYVRYNGNGKLEAEDDGTIGFAGKVIAGAGVYYPVSSRFRLGGDYEFGQPGRLRLVARFSF